MSPQRRAQSVKQPRVHDTAEEIMVRSVPVVSLNTRASEVRRRIGIEKFEAIDVVLVVDGDGAYVGAVPIADVLASDGDLKMTEIVKKDWPAIHPQWSQEHAAQAAAAAGIVVTAGHLGQAPSFGMHSGFAAAQRAWPGASRGRASPGWHVA